VARHGNDDMQEASKPLTMFQQLPTAGVGCCHCNCAGFPFHQPRPLNYPLLTFIRQQLTGNRNKVIDNSETI